MGAIVLAVVIFIVGMGVWIFSGRAAAASRKDSEDQRIYGIIATIGLVAGLIISALVFVLNCWTTVAPGNVGISILFGDVDPIPLRPGAHFINPMKDVIEMSTQVQAVKDDHAAASKDLQDVKVTLGANYHLQADAAPRIYSEIGINWAEKIIPNAERETLKAEIAHHNASDILQNRPSIKATVQSSMSEWLGKYGITLDELSIQNISFGPEYTDAIEAKQVEEQRALQKTYELQAANKQAEIAKAKAGGDADAAIETARGAAGAVRAAAEAEADSIRLRATAQAEANAKIAASLTGVDGERVIRIEQIKKWSGLLPATMLGGGVVPFFDVSSTK